MHRLGTLAGFNPGITPSLSTGPVAPPLTFTPSTSPSSTAISSAPVLHSSASGVGITDKDNPWRTLHVHVLPLFNEEPLRVPMYAYCMIVWCTWSNYMQRRPQRPRTAAHTNGSGFVPFKNPCHSRNRRARTHRSRHGHSQCQAC